MAREDGGENGGGGETVVDIVLAGAGLSGLFGGGSGPSKQAQIRARSVDQQLSLQRQNLAQAERRLAKKQTVGRIRAVRRQMRRVASLENIERLVGGVISVGAALKQLPGSPTVTRAILRGGAASTPSIVTSSILPPAPGTPLPPSQPSTVPSPGGPIGPGGLTPAGRRLRQLLQLLLMFRGFGATSSDGSGGSTKLVIKQGGSPVGFDQFMRDVGGFAGNILTTLQGTAERGAVGLPGSFIGPVQPNVPQTQQAFAGLSPAMLAALAGGAGALAFGGNGPDVEGQADVGDLTRALGLSSGSQLFRSVSGGIRQKSMHQEFINGRCYTWLAATPYRWKVKGTLVGGGHSHRHTHRRRRPR